MAGNIYKLLRTTLFTVILFACNTENYTPIENFQLNNDKTTDALYSIMYKFNDNTNETTLKKDYLYERFKIVHISDPHLSNWTADNHYNFPKNLMEAVNFANQKQLRINAMVATGDFISNTETTNAIEAKMFLSAFNSFYYTPNNIPSFLCTGNHDQNMLTNTPSYYLSKQDLHETLFARKNYTLKQPFGENYFYTDVNAPDGSIIRFISLDNTDQDNKSYKSMNYSCITQKQVNWLTQTALKENMTDNHHIIILTHHPLQPYSKNQETYMCSGNHLYDEKLIPDIINAFITKTIIRRCYHTVTAPKQIIQIETDFTDTPGDFICYLGGHTHTYAHFDVKNNDSPNVKQVMLLANTLAPDLQNNKYIYIHREKESLTSNSFSIYAIDTKEKMIYITYFGAKSDNTPTIETISYR